MGGEGGREGEREGGRGGEERCEFEARSTVLAHSYCTVRYAQLLHRLRYSQTSPSLGTQTLITAES